MPNLNLTAKVILSALISALLTGVTAFFVYRNLGKVEEAERWVLHTYDVIDKFNTAESQVERMSGLQRGWLMSGDDELMNHYKESQKAFDQVIAEGQRLVSDNPAQVARFKKIADTQKEWRDGPVVRYAQLRERLAAKQISGDDVLKGFKETGARAMLQTMRAELEEGVKMESALITKRGEEAKESFEVMRLWILAGLPFAIFTGLALLLLVTRTVSATMKRVEDLIEPLTGASTGLQSASGEIASSSESLSQSATEQASSLEETAASIEEMSSMVKKNSENSRQAAVLSDASFQSANRGRVVVSDMVRAMGDINQSTESIRVQLEESNGKLADIVKVINEIGNKTKVINEIVFQTKLLSFNASVEAARAGEHGKGFAVVAEEVGNLAQMSGNAAKEISSMLDQSVLRVESIVTETREKVDRLVRTGQESAQKGTGIATDCGKVLEEIVGSVEKVSRMAKDIAAASQEQAQGIEEITRAMAQLDQVTQQNSSSAEQAANAGAELKSQSVTLRRIVRSLIETIKGPDAVSALAQGGESEGDSRDSFSPVRRNKATATSTATGRRKAAPMRRSPRESTVDGFAQAAGAETFGDSGTRGTPREDDPRFRDV